MNKENFLLKEICEIRTGYQKRTRIGNKYRLIKLTNLNEDGSMNFTDMDSFGTEEIKPRYIVKKDEILFKSKSSQNTAGLYLGEEENLVASGHFFILSIKENFKERIIPGYIAWYLREETAQRHFKKFAAGMAMPTVRKSDLQMLNVALPAIEIQNLIAETYELMLEEKELLTSYMEDRKKQIKSLLRNFL